MNTIFVGSGAISLRHLANWKKLFPHALVSIVSRARPKGLCETVKHYSSLSDALLERPACVVLSNPAVWHVASAMEALEAGAHVFCEKPVSTSSESVEELFELAEKKRRVFWVGYNLRFHACLQKIKEQIEGGAIGRLLTLFLEIGQYLPDWRPHIDYRVSVSAQRKLGGGALLELSHEIDAALWLSGGKLKSVQGTCGQTGELELDVEDYANIAMSFNSGVSAMLHLDFIQRPGHRTYRLIGSKGALDWDSRKSKITLTDFSTGEIEVHEVPESEDRNHSYMRQFKEFVKQTKSEEFVPVASKEALAVLECISSVRAQQGVNDLVS